MSKSGIRPIDLRFPVGGLVERFGHQQGPVFSTPDCLNVRPYDTLQGRMRGGSRPGLTKAFNDLLGSGNPVRLLSCVTYVETDGFQSLLDEFEGTTLGGAWSAASWTAGLPTILPQDYSQVVYGTTGGAVRRAESYDTASVYIVETEIIPYNGRHNGKYQIFLRMDNTTPVATTAGVVAELIMNDATGAYDGTLKVYVAGVPTSYAFTAGTDGSPQTGWFSVSVSTNTITVTWNSHVLLTQAISAAAGARIGFGMEPTVSGGICLVDAFRLQYKTTTKEQTRRRILLASANGSVYRETTLGTLTSIGGSVNLGSDRLLNAAEMAQKLYIADHGNPRVLGSGGTITNDAGGDILDDAAVTDWTTYSIDTNNDVMIISAVTGGAVAMTSKILSVASGSVVMTRTDNATGTCTYRIERAPKVYDPALNTLTILYATTGQVPTGCPCIAVYRQRLVLAGQPIAPHAWFMSRQADSTDWDYSQEDAAAAVAGTTANAGQVGEDITALCAFSDDFLLFGCPNSLWVMRGDPLAGGSLDNLSRNVGVVSRGAWCRGPSNEFIFLSRDGLYMLAPGASQVPQPISRDQLPRQLRDIDAKNSTVNLVYDPQLRGVHIYISDNASGAGRKHWWLDFTTKGFWPMSFASGHEPMAVLDYSSASPSAATVIVGCRDGYVRRYREDQEDDDGTVFSNFVTYGPVKLGSSDFYEGKLLELANCTLGANSGDVTASVHRGETHEAAYQSAAFKSYTLSAGINHSKRPKARGASFFLKLTGTSRRRWTVERMTGLIETCGKQRLA